MAPFDMLPNELLEFVVGHVLDGKTNHFDYVATPVVQSVRLVCRTLHTIATPLLFENMVLDLKLWETGDLDMRRLVTFAIKNPELAKLVRRLQLQVPPIIIGSDFRGHRAIADMFGDEMAHNGWTSEQGSIIHDMLVPALHKWEIDEENALYIPPHIAGVAIYDTFRILPNLRHVEHAVSTYYRKPFGNLESKILDKTGLSVSHDRLIGISMERSLIRSFRLISTSLTHSINSLKLHNISCFPEASYKPCDGGQTFPALQHLDLGISADILFQKRRHWTRSSISYFKHLRTLRIEWETDCEDHFYIDELFIAYGDNSNVTKFPHLKSLTLVKFWLSHHAFLAIAASHASTLKELELIQVTLDSSCWPKSWSEMDALCKNALPSLTYLRLAQLISHTADSPPETWVEVPEAATTYEWTKGIHGATPMTGNWCATRKEEKTEPQGSLP